MPLRFFYLLCSFLCLACGEAGRSKSATNNSGASDDARGEDAEKPKIAITSPAQSLETDQDLEVQIKLSGTTKKLTWNLYFRSLDDDTLKETPIAEGKDARETKLTWSTASVTAGSYALVATFTSPAGKGRSQSKGKIVIKEGSRPTVTISSPIPEKVLLTSAPQQITFKGEDPNQTTLTYKIEVSSNGGKTWTTVTDGLSKTSYPWNLKSFKQGAQYKIKVTATNARGLSSSAIMPKPFGIASEPITYGTKFSAFLSEKCAACHAVGTVNATQFRCDSYDLATTGVSAKADSIKKRIFDGTMPPQSKMTEAEKDLVMLWYWGGAQ